MATVGPRAPLGCAVRGGRVVVAHRPVSPRGRRGRRTSVPAVGRLSVRDRAPRQRGGVRRCHWRRSRLALAVERRAARRVAEWVLSSLLRAGRVILIRSSCTSRRPCSAPGLNLSQFSPSGMNERLSVRAAAASRWVDTLEYGLPKPRLLGRTHGRTRSVSRPDAGEYAGGGPADWDGTWGCWTCSGCCCAGKRLLTRGVIVPGLSAVGLSEGAVRRAWVARDLRPGPLVEPLLVATPLCADATGAARGVPRPLAGRATPVGGQTDVGRRAPVRARAGDRWSASRSWRCWPGRS